MASRRKLKKHAPERLLEKLASSDPETRWNAARDLSRHGDRSTILPLEQVALFDTDSFSREGAFVDSIEAPYDAAFDALGSIYARHPPSPEDLVRVREWVANPDLSTERAEALASTLGKAAIETAEPLLQHSDVAIRLRAVNVIARARRTRANEALWADDEDVRFAATQQDAYRSRLVHDALERFVDEPSLRVRRGICNLWLRYRKRMGGSLYAHELAVLLVDPDPEIHTPVAQEVLDRVARSPTSWTYDVLGFRPIREPLANLIATAPPSAFLLEEVLEVIDRWLAPFAHLP